MYQSASLYLKWAYAVVILSAVLPMIAIAVWVIFTTGGVSGVTFLGSVALFGLGLYRVFLVAKVPTTLDAPEIVGFGKTLRKIGILLLFLGAALGALNLILRPLLLALPTQYTTGTPALLVVGLYLSGLGGLGLLGLFFFEFSRLLGFEQNARK